MIGTKQAAEILGVKPGALTRAVWENRLPAPEKGPGGAFVWSREDLQRAAWALWERELDELTKKQGGES
jgi:hypothetical protein